MFTFSAFDKDGKRVCGASNLKSENAVMSHLQKKDLSAIKIHTSLTRYVFNSYQNVSAKELSIFCRQMSVMFFSQITVSEGVQLLSEQTDNKQLKIALGEIYEHMSNGYSFAEAMQMYENIFSSYLLCMITIGETTGTLDKVFTDLADYFDKEHKMMKKVRSAVAYPAVLTALMGAIVLFLILKILPMFQETLNSMGGDIPEITKIILSVSLFLKYLAPYIVLFIIAAVIVLGFYSRTKQGKLIFDRLVISMPFLRSIYSKLITARFSRSLGILLNSGVLPLNSLNEIIPLINNKYVEKQFKNSISDIKNGSGLSEALSNVSILPPLFLRMLRIGQTSGNLDDMLMKSAVIFDDEVDDALQRLTLLLEPLLIIILSVIVGIILVSVMLPMISIMNKIG